MFDLRPSPVPPPAAAQPWLARSQTWFLLLPILTAGMFAFAVPLWAAARAGRHKTDPELWAGRQRANLYVHAVGFAAAVGAWLVLDSFVTVDAQGAATGVLGTLASLLLLGLWIFSIVYTVRLRRRAFPATPPVTPASLDSLPGVALARQRRQLREQYRQLALSDPLVACEIGVGRPDRARNFDDGGLLDVNSVDATVLVVHGQLSRQEAEKVVAARDELGRLSTPDELRLYTDLNEPAIERLREYGVFTL